MPMRRPLLAALVLLAGLSAPAAAQSLSTVPAAADAANAEKLRARIADLQRQLRQAEAREDAGKTFWQKTRDHLSRMLPITLAAWLWFVVGFGGEFVFFLRFVVQWLASERHKRTVVPMAFWHLSLVGTAMVLAYAVYRIDPVFILAYSLNVVIYVRNLYIARNNPALQAVMEKESE